jgi:2'-5' RNA ligase
MVAALCEVGHSGTIEISVRGLGWFPDVRRPRVFWAGVIAGESLTMLAHSTERAVAKLGVPVERRAYTPHLTLARVKDAEPVDGVLKAMGDPDFGAFQAFSFALYVSSNGRYFKLAEFPLNS